MARLRAGVIGIKAIKEAPLTFSFFFNTFKVHFYRSVSSFVSHFFTRAGRVNPFNLSCGELQ